MGDKSGVRRVAAGTALETLIAQWLVVAHLWAHAGTAPGEHVAQPARLLDIRPLLSHRAVPLQWRRSGQVWPQAGLNAVGRCAAQGERRVGNSTAGGALNARTEGRPGGKANPLVGTAPRG